MGGALRAWLKVTLQAAINSIGNAILNGPDSQVDYYKALVDIMKLL